MDFELTAASREAFLAQDRGPSLIATSVLFIVLSTVFVGLRVYVRNYLSRTPLSASDVILFFAWVAEIGLCANGILMVKDASTGRHIAYIVTLDPARIPLHFKGILVTEFLHPAAVAFPKLIVVMLYLHVLTNKYERYAAKGLVVFIIAAWFSYTIAACFQCMPFAFNWDKTIANGRCFSIDDYANSSSIPNIISDIAVLLLPIRTVIGLKMSIARRVGLLLVFFSGSMGIIASLIRTVVFAKTLARAGPLDDSPWNHVALVKWTTIEPGIYLMSACALSFRPLFRIIAEFLHLQALLTKTIYAKSQMRTSRQKTGTGMRTGHRDYVEMDSLKTLHENLGMAGVTITKTVSVEVEVVR